MRLAKSNKIFCGIGIRRETHNLDKMGENDRLKKKGRLANKDIKSGSREIEWKKRTYNPST